MRSCGLGLVLLLSMAAASCAQRPGGFQVIGPGGGGAMYRPTIDPHDPQTLLVACDMGGAYITHDGGRSWRMFNLHGVVNVFAFDPKDPAVIYAGGTGLWKSSDKGATWKLLLPRPSKFAGVIDSSIDADETLLSIDADETLLSNDAFANHDGSLENVLAMAVDPADGLQIAVALGKLLVTTKDGGEHWNASMTLPDRPNQLLMTKGQAGKPNLWMSSLNGFWNLRHPGRKLPSMDFTVPLRTGGMVSAQGHLEMYASSGTHLFHATVNAEDDSPTPAWRTIDLPGTNAMVSAFATSADGRTAYVSYTNLQLEGKTWGGVARSTDGGGTWALVLKVSDNGEPPQNVDDGWISSTFDPWWGEEPLGLAVAPNDPQTLYTTDLGRTMKSTDGGVHWSNLYTRMTGSGSYASTGLDVLTSYGVHVDPFDPKRIFIGYTDVGLFRSEDDGISWIPSHEGVPRKWRANSYWVVFDPAVKGKMWAAMSRTHDLPQPRMWRRKEVTTFSGGVCVSNDGGRHWQAASKGIPDSAITHLVLDPKSPTGHRTLYAASFGRGVFKSTDGGETWQEKNVGLARGGAFSWRMALAGDGTLYLVVIRESNATQVLNNERDGALYRSRDGAEHWEKVALPAGVSAPMGISVDPRDPSKLYLAAWARAVGKHGEGGGVYGSRDGGASWQMLLPGEQHAYDVTYNPANPSELYVAGFGSSAWRSTDEGAHWKRIAGFNFKNGHRVMADPVHPGQVYITTFGGGVWHGAADGAPGVEDVVTKELMPH